MKPSHDSVLMLIKRSDSLLCNKQIRGMIRNKPLLGVHWWRLTDFLLTHNFTAFYNCISLNAAACNQISWSWYWWRNSKLYYFMSIWSIDYCKLINSTLMQNSIRCIWSKLFCRDMIACIFDGSLLAIKYQ